MTLGENLTAHFSGPRKLSKRFEIGAADVPVLNPSYSMQGEDLVVRSLLKNTLKSGKAGIYVDLGAYVPRYGSNTYLFYQYGWQGICVEPNPAAAAHFKTERPRDLFVAAAVGPDGPGYWARSKVDDAHSIVARTNDAFGPDYHPPIEVPFLSMKTIFERHVAAGAEIDYLNIDLEGFELVALEGNDWSRFRPRIILIEDNALDIENLWASPALAFLRNEGYAARAVLPPNIILVAS